MVNASPTLAGRARISCGVILAQMRYRDRVKMLLPAGIIAVLLLLAIGINGLQMLPGRPFNLGDQVR